MAENSNSVMKFNLHYLLNTVCRSSFWFDSERYQADAHGDKDQLKDVKL